MGCCPFHLPVDRLRLAPGLLGVADLWCRYLILGGTAHRDGLIVYLTGTADWPAREHNILAHTLNEYLWDLGLPELAPMRRPAV